MALVYSTARPTFLSFVCIPHNSTLHIRPPSSKFLNLLTVGHFRHRHNHPHIMSNDKPDNEWMSVYGIGPGSVDWADIWKSAKEGSGQKYTLPSSVPQRTPAPPSFQSASNSKVTLPPPSSICKVKLPPPSEKHWLWKCNDGQPDRYIVKPAESHLQPVITIFVLHNPESGTTLLAPVLPAWNDAEAATWADPAVLSETFAKLSETLDIIDPSACFSLKPQAHNSQRSARYDWWHVRALNTVVAASDAYSVTIGNRQHCLRFNKAPDGTHVKTGDYYPTLEDITLGVTPSKSLYVIPSPQKGKFLDKLPVDHPSYHPLKTKDG